MTKTHTRIEARLNQLASYVIGEKLTKDQLDVLNSEAFLYGLHEEFSQTELNINHPFENSLMVVNNEIFKNLQEAVLN